jgi:DNA mismatch repair protein MutL
VTPRPVKRLSEGVVNRIAAGEVVERPASVVKELMENSLDAGAGRIVVGVRGAGRELVSVADDGHGMTPEDALLALERHATSKIAGEADLDAISTLGFRGEALAAIFAVSRFRVASRARGSLHGVLILGEGGAIGETGELDVPEGTTVEVRDVFFNTPARAKFLKSPATEQGAILRVMTQLAVAHPTVEMRLTANGRLVLQAPAAAGGRERLGALYGFGLAARLLDAQAEQAGVRLSALVAPPALARTHREDIHFIVNGRPVRDTLLTQALLEAYRPRLPRDQFPVALVVLEVPPGQVDVNVHPTKAWVRFRQPRLVHGLVHEAVAVALRRVDATPTQRLQPATQETPAAGAAASPVAPDPFGQASLFREAEAPYPATTGFGQPIGQIEDTFIVAYTAEEVFFIDQHVAHERVLFERLRAELDGGPLPGQELLFPRPLELQPARRRAVEGALADLDRLGFAIEGFGGDALLLRGVPAALRADEPERLVDDLAREIEDGSAQGLSSVLDRVLAFVACRGAIKANQALGPEEMGRLLADLAATAAPFHCPHGRPIMSRVPLREIRRELKRDW